MIRSAETLRLTGNLLSNYAYVGLLAAITLFAVPVYVHTLGPSQWGNVALCWSLQGLLFSLDLILGPLTMREIARAAAAGKLRSVYLRFLRYYVATALIASVMGLSALLWIGHMRLLQGEPLAADLTTAICLAMVQFLFQFSNNAAMAFWNGLERQHFANVRMAAFMFAKHAAAMVLVTSWMASAAVYMIPFAIICAIEFTLNHRLVTMELKGAPRTDAVASLTADRRDAAWFAGASMLGIATTQVDKIFLALSVSIEQFGVYVAITSPILSLLSVQMPIQRAFLPRIVTAASPRRIALSMLAVTTALIVLPCLAMSAASQFILLLWLRDASIAAAGALPFRLLLIAVALIAVFSPVSMLLLHYHRNRTIAVIPVAILLAQLIVLAMLTPRLGITAAALAWLASGIIQAGSAAVLWRSFPR